MISLKKKINNRYILFLSISIFLFVLIFVSVQKHISAQENDAFLINKSGKQRMLSQRISKLIFKINKSSNSIYINQYIDTLKVLTKEFNNSHNFLYSEYIANTKNKKLDSLYTAISKELTVISETSNNIIALKTIGLDSISRSNLEKSELSFLHSMDAIVNEYQKNAEFKLVKIKNRFYFFSFLSILVFIGGFYFLLVPTIRSLIKKGVDLNISNKALKTSQKEINDNLIELKELKNNLEIKDKYNQIFIEQAAPSLAMLDKNMVYMAVSEKWKKDYKMEGLKVIGKSHYEVFPEIGEEWKQKHQRCLKGEINTCDEFPFVRKDGSIQWIFWDVRPWYLSDDEIGGLLMHTGDITEQKNQNFEKEKIESILKKTNEVAKIGTWELDIASDKLNFSPMSKEILQITNDEQIYGKTSLGFYKEGLSRRKIIKAIQTIKKTGKPFDLELEVVTKTNKNIWVRDIGQAEFINGKCVRAFGVVQDITQLKLAQKELIKQNQLLLFAEKINNIGNWQWDFKTSEVLWSSGLYSIMGLVNNGETITIEKFAGYAHPEDADELNLHIKKTIENKKFAGELIHRVITEEGIIKVIQVSGKVFTDENDEIVSIIGSFQDITRIKDVEYSLIKQNELLNFSEKINNIGNWQWDFKTNNVKWSQGFYNIMNITPTKEPMSLEEFLSFAHPDDADKVQLHVEKTIENKKFEGNDLTCRVITKDGITKTVQILGKVFTNQKNEIIEIIGTCQDITNQRIAEIKFKGLLESAPDAVIILNENKKIHLINNEAEKMFGYSASELLDKNPEMLIPNSFKEEFANYMEAYFLNPLALKMGENREVIGLNKIGEEFPVQISLSPLQTEEGLLISAAIRDVTIQKQAAQKIINANNNLELLSKELTNQNTQLADFAHITSHNLRAPVSNLNSLIEIYNMASNEEEKHIIFEKFEKVISHLTLTLNTLVDALKVKNQDALKEEVIFSKTLKKTKELLAAQILETGAIITSNFKAINNTIYNKIYFESIFLNLVENAIKYRASDRVPKIHLETTMDKGKITLKISDNGLGIDLKRHGLKLFGLNKVFHRHPDAKGVGLFMTKLHVQSMGGTITATSKVNEGTIFTINFN